MSAGERILITGAAGRIGSVGFKLVELLTAKGLVVRALVRKKDDRSEALARLGAEIVVGDLTSLHDMNRVIEGCRRIFFCLSVSSCTLEATINTAAVAKHHGVDLFVNISQMTVSQMSISETTTSVQQKYHWLGEQALNWSGLPVVHVRPTVFLEHPFFFQFAAESIAKTSEIRVPLGSGHTSPIATIDVARVIAEILVTPKESVQRGRIYQLTGPKSQNMNEIAKEYSVALGKEIKYVDVDPEEFKKDLESKGLPAHMVNHLTTMAALHRKDRYNRFTDDVEKVTGSRATSVEEWVRTNAKEFTRAPDLSNLTQG